MSTAIDRRWLLGLCIAVSPALIYFAFLTAITRNIPRGDDFFSILGFLSDWRESSSWAERLALINEQYFSHRIALTRIVALLQWWFTGECHFVTLQVFGWIGWIGVSASLAFSVPVTRQHPWLALPVFLLLMQPYGASNLLSAMQAVQNVGVVALALLGVHLATRASQFSAALALAIAAVATFTSSNGLLVAPVLVVIWLARAHYRRAIGGLVIGALIAIVYFSGYVHESTTFSGRAFLANAAVVAGASVAIARMPLLVVGIIGALILGLGALLLLQRRRWCSRPAHLGFVLFLILSVLMIAWGRMDWGADYVTQDRYRIYSLLTLATLYVLMIAPEVPGQPTRIGALAAGAAAVFSLLAYISSAAPLLGYARWTEATTLNHSIGGHFLLTSGPTWKSEVRSLQRAAEFGIYQLPSPLNAETVAQLRAFPVVPSSDPSPFKVVPNAGTLGYALEPVSDGAVAPAEFVLAVHRDDRVVLPLHVHRAPLSRAFGHLTIFGSAFAYPWPSERYLPGEQTLYGLNRSSESGEFVVAWRHSVVCPSFH